MEHAELPEAEREKVETEVLFRILSELHNIPRGRRTDIVCAVAAFFGINL